MHIITVGTTVAVAVDVHIITVAVAIITIATVAVDVHIITGAVRVHGTKFARFSHVVSEAFCAAAQQQERENGAFILRKYKNM